MIYIRKGRSPQVLLDYKALEGSTYEEFRDKDIVKEALLHEQGQLCAYCMKRISKDTMKIEHYFPQNPETEDVEELSKASILSLDYSNMLGVCFGGEGFSPDAQTCDTHKKNDKLKKLNPLDESTIDKIEYLHDGTIKSKDEDISYDLNNILNLNSDKTYLKENRKAVIQRLNTFLYSKQSTGTWNTALLKQAKRHFLATAQDPKPEYIGVLLFFLEKYQRKANA